MTSTFLFW